MKRHALVVGLFFLLLAACAPQPQVETNVVPTLVSVRHEGDALVLQGRYFGDGAGGEAQGSYVLLGADIAAQGGIRVKPANWTPSRIELQVPEGAGYGFVYVFVDGIRSNGLPVDLP